MSPKRLRHVMRARVYHQFEVNVAKAGLTEDSPDSQYDKAMSDAMKSVAKDFGLVAEVQPYDDNTIYTHPSGAVLCHYQPATGNTPAHVY